jgi:hypothetical protein
MEGWAMAAPDAPTGLTATLDGDHVLLSWTAPANNGGSAITRYVVKSGTSSATLTEVDDGPTGPETTWRAPVQATQRAQTLFFAVAATNADGTGVDSNVPSVEIPALDVPEISARAYLLSLAAMVALVVALRFLVREFLPPAADLNVSLPEGVDDTAEGAFGHAALAAAAQVALELVAWGIAFLVAAFVPVSIASALSSVKITKAERRGVGPLSTTALPSLDLSSTLKATGDLLRTPAGFGGLLVSLGALLLIFALFSPPASPTQQPEASPSAAPPSGEVPPVSDPPGTPGST